MFVDVLKSPNAENVAAPTETHSVGTTNNDKNIVFIFPLNKCGEDPYGVHQFRSMLSPESLDCKKAGSERVARLADRRGRGWRNSRERWIGWQAETAVTIAKRLTP